MERGSRTERRRGRDSTALRRGARMRSWSSPLLRCCFACRGRTRSSAPGTGSSRQSSFWVISSPARCAVRWLARRRGCCGARVRISVEAAATFTLVLAFGVACRAVNADASRFWLLAAAARARRVASGSAVERRAGWLTNYWIVSGLLLGLGQVLGLREMGVANQLGARLGLASIALAASLLGSAAAVRTSLAGNSAAGRSAPSCSDRRRRAPAR